VQVQPRPPMAQQARTKRFVVALSHVDENVYRELDLRLAQQPSETDAFLLTRLIAYCFLARDDEGTTLQFSKGGLTTPEEPAIARTTLDGRIVVWCEIGNPSVERLHKASKAAPHVVLFTQHNPTRLSEELQHATIFRKEELEIWAVDPVFLAELGAVLVERSTELALTLADQTLYVTVGDQALSSPLTPVRLPVS
jgi:uncharacterized protein YaeQ